MMEGPALTERTASPDMVRAFLGLFALADESTAGALSPITRCEMISVDGESVPHYINEFWTSRQRQASTLHELSYRACFKPQLPGFFIRLLTREGETVYDPFSGRGTTAIEAGLLGRQVIANDINPLSAILTAPRFTLPQEGEVAERLDQVPEGKVGADLDLSMFYHPETEATLVALRRYLIDRYQSGDEDQVDRWIRMVATNRLTGHSKNFFSVYTLPPNQAVSQESQCRINTKRGQVPPYKDVHVIIERKSRQLLSGVSSDERAGLASVGAGASFLTGDARETPTIRSGSVALTVTSPPFLDIVQYARDNWLRCWFNDLDAQAIGRGITMARTVEGWSSVMGEVFDELYRVTRSGGWVAFEVGEVRRGTISLDQHVVPLGRAAGFSCEGIVVNTQQFTKTSQIWGVANNACGTNTNRIVLFYKP
ncbi:DNA methyltransferase [Methanosphaerula palustris]|nr:DNA methyltransferase [Methanosphaerula palustris]